MSLRNVRRWSRYLARTAFNASQRHFERRQKRAENDLANGEMSKFNRVVAEKDNHFNRVRLSRGVDPINVRIAGTIMVETALHNTRMNRFFSPREYRKIKEASLRMIHYSTVREALLVKLKNKFENTIPMEDQLRLENHYSRMNEQLSIIEKIGGRHASAYLNELLELLRVSAQITRS